MHLNILSLARVPLNDIARQAARPREYRAGCAASATPLTPFDGFKKMAMITAACVAAATPSISQAQSGTENGLSNGNASLARAERMYAGGGEDPSSPPASVPTDVTARLKAHASIPSNETLVTLFRIVFRKAGEFIANSPSGNLAQNLLNNSPGNTGSTDPVLTNIIGGYINAFGGGAVVKAAGNRFVQWADTAAVSIRSRQLYEGNWVVYMNVRPAGQDGVDVEKMVVTKDGGEWVASLPQLRALLP